MQIRTNNPYFSRPIDPEDVFRTGDYDRWVFGYILVAEPFYNIIYKQWIAPFKSKCVQASKANDFRFKINRTGKNIRLRLITDNYDKWLKTAPEPPKVHYKALIAEIEVSINEKNYKECLALLEYIAEDIGPARSEIKNCPRINKYLS